MQKFSDALIQKMIDYAWEHYRLKITADEAEEYLRSLANVILTFQKVEARKHKKQKDG